MIEIKFQADNATDLKNKILSMAQVFSAETTQVQMPFPIADAPTVKEMKVRTAEPAPLPETKKTKAKKEKTPEPEEVEETDIIHTGSLKEIAATQTDVVDALKQVNTAKGMAAARKIMTDLGYNKIAEIKPEHYEAVVQACEKLLGVEVA